MGVLGLGEPPVSSQITDELFRFKYYSNAKARKELGWRPRDDLKAAVLDAMQYYGEHGLI